MLLVTHQQSMPLRGTHTLFCDHGTFCTLNKAPDGTGYDGLKQRRPELMFAFRVDY